MPPVAACTASGSGRRAVRRGPRLDAVLLRTGHRGHRRRGRPPRPRRAAGRARGAARADGEFDLADLILLCPCGSADVEVLDRARPANSLDGSELTCALPAGAATTARSITLVGPRPPPRPWSWPRPRPPPRTTTCRPHRDDLSRAEGARQERRSGRAEPTVAGRTQHPGAQRHQLARRRQDHAARAHHPRDPAAGDRSPSSKATRRRCSTPNASAPPVRASSRSTPAPAVTSTPR